MHAERHGPWTVGDLHRMPEDEFHLYEIDDGVLIVSPRHSSAHQAASYRIARLLDDAIAEAGADLAVVQEVEAVTDRRDDWLKVPDLVVVSADAFDVAPQEYEAADVVLAVEISGNRQSLKRDLGEKLDAYAEVGIENYWVVELTPAPRLTVFTLAAGRYTEDVVTGRSVELTEPVPVAVDPSLLVGRRRGRDLRGTRGVR